MKPDRTSREVLQASLIGFVGILILGGILLLLDIGSLLAKGESWAFIFSFLSVSIRDSAPWAFIAGGFVAGLYLRSLLLRPILTATLLVNVYIFVFSLVFHSAVVTFSLFLVMIQVRTFVLGTVIFGISLSIGSLVRLEKERREVR
ncbi:MAG: hypothetical protein ACE5HJ_07365 [Thermoplasmata archaeon]